MKRSEDFFSSPPLRSFKACIIDSRVHLRQESGSLAALRFEKDIRYSESFHLCRQAKFSFQIKTNSDAGIISRRFFFFLKLESRLRVAGNVPMSFKRRALPWYGPNMSWFINRCFDPLNRSTRSSPAAPSQKYIVARLLTFFLSSWEFASPVC